MAYILSNSGRKSYGTKTYMVNTMEEMKAIPLTSNLKPGSTVLVASGGKYILSNNYKWEPLGGSQIDTDYEEVIYEGGDIELLTVEEEIAFEGGEI